MSPKKYNLLSGFIFLAIAVLHLVRIFYGWEASIGGWIVPLRLSWMALVISGFLSYSGLRQKK